MFTEEQLKVMLWQSLAMQIGYSNALEEVINAYRKPIEKKAN